MNKIGITEVKTNKGPVEVPMWAEFRFEIGDRNPLFRVTSPFRVQNGRIHKGEFRFIVTHVGSGGIFTDFGFKEVAETRYNLGRNNYGRAGAMAVKEVLDTHGITKILRALERYSDD